MSRKKISSRTAGSQVGLAGDFLTEQSPFELGDSYFFNLFLWHCIHFLRALADTKAGPCLAFCALARADPQPGRANWEPGSGGRASSQSLAASLAPGIPESQCLRLPKASKPGSSEIYQTSREKHIKILLYWFLNEMLNLPISTASTTSLWGGYSLSNDHHRIYLSCSGSS